MTSLIHEAVDISRHARQGDTVLNIYFFFTQHGKPVVQRCSTEPGLDIYNRCVSSRERVSAHHDEAGGQRPAPRQPRHAGVPSLRPAALLRLQTLVRLQLVAPCPGPALAMVMVPSPALASLRSGVRGVEAGPAPGPRRGHLLCVVTRPPRRSRGRPPRGSTCRPSRCSPRVLPCHQPPVLRHRDLHLRGLLPRVPAAPQHAASEEHAAAVARRRHPLEEDEVGGLGPEVAAAGHGVPEAAAAVEGAGDRAGGGVSKREVPRTQTWQHSMAIPKLFGIVKLLSMILIFPNIPKHVKLSKHDYESGNCAIYIKSHRPCLCRTPRLP